MIRMNRFKLRRYGAMLSRGLACYMAVFGLCCCSTSAAPASEAVTKDGPNVLFIISDDLSTALGAYGHQQCKTPNLDALAKRGVVFERAYCQFPVCGQSRSSLLTGQYPDLLTPTGFRKKYPRLVTLPQYFKNNGFYAARISKIYHMGVPPNIAAGTSGPDDRLSWDRTFNVKAAESKTKGEREFLSPKQKSVGGAMITVKGPEDDSLYVDGIATAEALKWLDELGDRRFFLAVGMVRPHVPFVAPKSYFDLYDPKEMIVPTPDSDMRDVPKPALCKHNSTFTGMNLTQQRKAVAGYYATVSYADALIGRILDKLTALGLDKNTIIVFTSDHGYNLGEHGCWEKQQLWEESIRVPLIISGPGIAKGVRCKKIVELVDLYPSLADLAGFQIPTDLVGQSLRPLVDPASTSTWTDKTYAYTTVNGKGHGSSIRTDRWRYNERPNCAPELYDHKNDSKEFTNVARNPENATVLTRMKALLQNAKSRAQFSK
jgi:iduronate 2-sulfatase